MYQWMSRQLGYILAPLSMKKSQQQFEFKRWDDVNQGEFPRYLIQESEE